MAELINEIVSPEAFKQVEQLKTDLAGLTKQMEDLLKKINTASPSGKGAFGGIPEDIKLAAEELKQLKLLQNQIITSQAKLTASQTAFGKEAALAKEQLKQYNAELRASAKEQTQAEGSLDQMRSKLNQLEKLYSAMSAEMRNAKVGQTIFADMVKAKEGVTLLEQSMGNYKRNVGNYQNSTFQLTQVLRELPAFTYSAQTGLMGISNNLPMLADAFGKVKQETGSTMGAIKVFGASLFSFSNIFAVAIGLATMFLPKLIEWASGTKAVDEATKKLADSVGQETAKFEALVRGLNDANLSQKERLNLAKELKEMYPKILDNYSAEEIAAGKAAGAINQIATALKSVAMARAAEDDLAKLAAKRYENEKKIAEEQAKLIENEQKARLQLGKVQQANNVRSVSQEMQFDSQIGKYNNLNEAINKGKKSIEDLAKEGVNTPAVASGLRNVPLVGGALGSAVNILPGALGGQTPEEQQLIQAKTNFITAVLRKESGAAIGKDEYATEDNKYFPKLGDSQAVIDQKADARRLAIKAIERQAGPGAKDIKAMQTQTPEIDPEIFKYMTPEQQALFKKKKQ